MAVLQHLVRQVEHGEVDLDAQPLTGVGQVVEEVGVAPLEMDGHHPAPGLHTLGDKGLLPRQVLDDSLLAPRAQPRGEHDDVVVRPESGLYHPGEIARLGTRLVDRDTQRSQAAQVHQQVIDEVFKKYPILSKVTDQEGLLQYIDDLIDEALKTVREIVRTEDAND